MTEEDRPFLDEDHSSITVVHVREEESEQQGGRFDGSVHPIHHDQFFPTSDLSPMSVALSLVGILQLNQLSPDELPQQFL